jgi:hypothetical protein
MATTTDTGPELEPVNSSQIKLETGTLPAATVDFESLQCYSEVKLAIANQLRTLLDLLKNRGDEARIQLCEQLMAKLAEDRLYNCRTWTVQAGQKFSA